jgi:hypothetical protein
MVETAGNLERLNAGTRRWRSITCARRMGSTVRVSGTAIATEGGEFEREPSSSRAEPCWLHKADCRPTSEFTPNEW